MSARRCVMCAKRLPDDSPRAVCGDLCRRARERRNKDRHRRRVAAGQVKPQARAGREVIPVAPFLLWCEKRAKLLYALYADDTSGGDGIGQLLDDIGWDRDNGARRLYRWRHDLSHGMVERAVVEDALWRAGVGLWELYPDVAAMDEAAA